jgi:phi LC3 family holin|nr:MAG TPA: holin [Caudoviricetes sp.]
MKINWTLRLQNKATLTALAATVLAFAYQLCGIFGIVPPVSQDSLLQLVGIVLNILVALGVVTDPTTSGLSDSARALGYDEPYTAEGK